jgi:hypothetical protein
MALPRWPLLLGPPPTMDRMPPRRPPRGRSPIMARLRSPLLYQPSEDRRSPRGRCHAVPDPHGRGPPTPPDASRHPRPLPRAPRRLLVACGRPDRQMDRTPRRPLHHAERRLHASRLPSRRPHHALSARRPLASILSQLFRILPDLVLGACAEPLCSCCLCLQMLLRRRVSPSFAKFPPVCL